MTANEERRARFISARLRVLGENTATDGIGRLSEKTLHRILKLYIEPNECLHEQTFLGSVADVVNSDGIYEIQTRAAERLIPKLRKFLPASRVCVVIPVITEKRLHWIDKTTGEISARRKSNKKESGYTALRELYKIRRFLSDENITVKLVYLKADDYRAYRGGNKSGHKGAVKLDCIPTELIGETDIASPRDYLRFLPDALVGEFTARELCAAAKIPLSLSSCAAGVLSAVGVIERVRKAGNAFVYRRCAGYAPDKIQ